MMKQICGVLCAFFLIWFTYMQVLTGYALDRGTATDSSLRRPPVIPSTDPLHPQLAAADPHASHAYSSVSGITGGSRVYMMYTTSAPWMYPHYLVTYK